MRSVGRAENRTRALCVLGSTLPTEPHVYTSTYTHVRVFKWTDQTVKEACRVGNMGVAAIDTPK